MKHMIAWAAMAVLSAPFWTHNYLVYPRTTIGKENGTLTQNLTTGAWQMNGGSKFLLECKAEEVYVYYFNAPVPVGPLQTNNQYLCER